MLTIKRTSMNKIITHALLIEGQPFIAILRAGADDCEPCENETHLLELIHKNPGAMIIYNQHTDAIKLIDRLQFPGRQVFVEIRQDTKGVLGLQAIHRTHSGPKTLELNYL